MLEDYTVLYVEDTKLMRRMIKDLLEDRVKEIYFANNGKEGLKQFIQHTPDIVISDINMPEMDGLQMSEKIKDILPDTPIVLLTCLDDIKSLKKAIEIGISSFISKPVQNDELLKEITKVVKTLQNKKDSDKLKEIEQQKEKIDLLLYMLKEIGHHWRQPLSSALTISSSYELKKRNDLYDSIEEEITDINSISVQLEKLSSIIQQVQSIDFENMSIEQIKNTIHTSNPIYYKE